MGSFFRATRSALVLAGWVGTLALAGCEDADGADLDADAPPVTTTDGGASDGGVGFDAGSADDGAVASDAGVSLDARVPGQDAALDDGGALDAGALDAGPLNGGSDAAPPEGGAPDAGTSDAGGSDAGSTDAGGSDAGRSDAGASDAAVSAGPPTNKLPSVKGACPDLRSGTVSVAGARVKLWVGPANRPGPMVFYFHGTGTSPDEVQQALSGAVEDVTRNGGIVASWDTSNETGDSTGNVWAVWFTGDFDAADQLVACGLQNGLIDPARIHVAGYSAGGLQTGAMLFMRSNYVASGIVYSGGKGFGASGFQDPSNVPNAVMAHGAAGQDALILDFHEWSTNLGTELKGAGAFVVDCNDGGGHVSFSRLGIQGKAWQFMKDHPYKRKPSPFAGGLSGWPNYCKIW